VALLLGAAHGSARAAESEAPATRSTTFAGGPWRARFAQYRANRQRANQAIKLAAELRKQGAPAIKPAHGARLEALKWQAWGSAAPAAGAALGIASHALLPGVYWHWQAIWTSALRGVLWATLGASALAGGSLVTDLARVGMLAKRRSGEAEGSEGDSAARSREAAALAWGKKISALSLPITYRT